MLDLIMRDILGTPAILVGLFALIGLVLQKKDIASIVSGTLKTIMGFVIIGAGAGVIIAALDIFGQMFDEAFSIRGVIPNNEAIVAVAQDAFGVETAMIMVFGMVMNIVLARITPFKYIFLTGHHTLFMASLLAAILSVSGLDGTLLIIVGSVLLGLCMVLFPALLQPFVRQITGSDDLQLDISGHSDILFQGQSENMRETKSIQPSRFKYRNNLAFYVIRR